MRSSTLALSVSLLAAAACGDNASPSGDPDAAPPQPDAAPEPGDPTTGAWTAGFELPGVSGAGSRVEAVELAPDGTLYAAGIFLDASAVPAANIAHWTGTDWEPLGAGVDGWVRAIELDGDGTLWAAVTDPNDLTSALMRWTGTAWETANTLDGAIRDLAVVAAGIAVVGDFTGSVRVLDPASDAWIDVTPDGITGAASAVAASPTGFCVAGSFDSIDGVTAENAACWNGTAWTALGAGLPGGVSVLARSPGGNWFAGGTLTFIVDNETGEYEAGIGRLSGGTWAPYQGGIDNGFINEVRAIAFDGDDVLVGGHFLTAGTSDVLVSHLARFTPGSGWSRVGGGLVNSVGVFLPSIVGTGDLAVADDGTIYVGGLFTAAGGVPAVSIARIPTTGAPTPLVGPHTVLGIGGFVDTVAAGPGGLIAGGGFAFAGQTPIDNLGVLAGTTWTELGGIEGIVRDVLVLDDGIIAVAGELTIDGQLAAYAEWDGTAWQTPGGRVEGFGFALARDPSDGTVWLGGDLFSVGATKLANLAHLEHGTWSAGAAFDGRINALVFQDAGLLAGGSFTTIDGAPARALAIRDPSTDTWIEHGGVDGEFPGVYSIAVSSLGIVIGGEFEGVDGVVAEDLAVYSGGAWHDLDAGFSHDDFSFVSTVYAYGDGVFVGGGFREIGGVATSNIGWYDGAAWHALGAGLQDLSEEMVVIDRVLYVGGPFTAAGDRPSAGIARWDFRTDGSR
jgi:hypothetical protein